MRLLLVTQDFPPNTGGIETYSFELAKRFVTSVEFFAVIAPTHEDADAFDRKLSFPVYRIPVKNSLLPLVAPFCVIYFMFKNKFDTAFHTQWQTSFASVLSRKAGYPKHIYVAAHARELLLRPFNGDNGWLSEKLHSIRKKLFKSIDGFFPVSNYTASLLHNDGVPQSDTYVVGNGTDPEVFKPKNTATLAEELDIGNKKVILSICRLVPRKGLDLVVEAMQQIVLSNEDVTYLIGGTGPDEGRLRALVTDLGLNDHIRFLGRIPDEKMASYYSMADVFVMPAGNNPPDVEGFGIVFLEANACETVVIGSRTGGIPDAVIHGETGYLIENKNVEQLIDSLLKLLNNEELANQMGKKGRERILREATWDHVSDSLLENMKRINKQSER
ncbi:glycosyltransferase family 4 protein [Balneolaceae bacterium YR4-1]|uniref:Glycosyltransferase family 4 protein n=1 Tax=Halalkalibaculum roseum TaxID=2709311 RepID=A0A6M1SNX6_9BACT|nr:glycosyltransferase family 4 protein [Halalkalibaculum roseum]NGP76779.1 glycosyltransferase family 4 protein [Halalkalibaculum roseum]